MVCGSSRFSSFACARPIFAARPGHKRRDSQKRCVHRHKESAMKTKAVSVVCLSVILIASVLAGAGSERAFRPFGARAREMRLVRPSAASTSNPSRASQPRLLANYGRLPLTFEANHGQTDRQNHAHSADGGGAHLPALPSQFLAHPSAGGDGQ